MPAAHTQRFLFNVQEPTRLCPWAPCGGGGGSAGSPGCPSAHAPLPPRVISTQGAEAEAKRARGSQPELCVRTGTGTSPSATTLRTQETHTNVVRPPTPGPGDTATDTCDRCGARLPRLRTGGPGARGLSGQGHRQAGLGKGGRCPGQDAPSCPEFAAGRAAWNPGLRSD